MVLTWLKIFTNSKETRTCNKLYNYFLQQSTTNCTFNVTLSVQVFTIGLYACLLAFRELLDGLVITATCPLVSGHLLSLDICTSLAFDR